jgi:hypothetical protein
MCGLTFVMLNLLVSKKIKYEINQFRKSLPQQALVNSKQKP